MKDNKKALYDIIDAIPASIYCKDINGVYLLCNQFMVVMAGKTNRSEIIGKTDYDMPWKNIADELHKIDSDVITQSVLYEVEETPRLASKRERIFLTKKTPLFDNNGEIYGLIGISFDITEKKEAGKLRTKIKETEGKLDTMQLLSASLAHELRTPLSTLRINLNFIKKELSNFVTSNDDKIVATTSKNLSALLNVIEKIDAEINNISTIINMLLIKSDSAGIDTTRYKTQSMPCCIDKALANYAFDAADRELVTCHTCNFNFHGDEMLMVHIVFNLLKNALHYIKAAHKGKVEIWCDTEQNKNILYFKDTGQGINEEDLPRIFERFFTKTHHGTGVGLAFCKMVMESFGGDITCRSTLHEFTEFKLTFPKLD